MKQESLTRLVRDRLAALVNRTQLTKLPLAEEGPAKSTYSIGLGLHCLRVLSVRNSSVADSATTSFV